jgi:zinc protease
MNRPFLLAAGALLAAGSLPAQAPESYPSTAPALGPPRPVALPQTVSRTLSNGLTVLYAPEREVPLATAVLVMRGGVADEPGELRGLAAFTAAMLDEGAAGRSALELGAELDLLGASLSTGAGWDAAQSSMLVLGKNLPRALELLADVVLRPDFPETEVVRLRQERLTNLRRSVDQPATIANNAFAGLAYPGGHPYGRFVTIGGTEHTDRAAMQAFHRRFYQPAEATLILTGDVDPDQVQPLVERLFGGWTASEPLPSAAPAGAPVHRPRTIYLVDRPGSQQSEIRLGHAAAPRSTPDYYPLMVMNTVLGGMSMARLNMNLRETHGFSYGAYSGLAMRRQPGPFVASAAVNTAKTDSAVAEFFREIERIRAEPVGEEELVRVRNYLALGFPAQLETAESLAGSLAQLVTSGANVETLSGYVQGVLSVTADDVLRVARQYLRPEETVVVVVGDRQAIEPGLRALGLGPVEVREMSEFTR